MSRQRALNALAIGVVMLPSILVHAQTGDLKAGLYAIWYSDSQPHFLDQPYISGGQIVLQWAQVEPERGRWDFSMIDQKLADFAKREKYATLQINGNIKPAWLFDVVPSVKDRLSVQVRDPQGTLMYWHPTHREAYLAMLRALGDHMKRAVNADRILGIRMNFNALGTEHHHVPKPFASPDVWAVPDGVERTSIVAWTKAVDDDYVQSVLDTYLASFRGTIRIFVRNSISEKLVKAYRTDFDNGTLSWFHTSSEVEPRAAFAEQQYRRFYDDCRSGHTTGYAEPWASAWGHHGGQVDDRWCSPPQWNYWRLLFDLHCGVSYIALYSADMRVAVEGKYRTSGTQYDDPDGDFPREFEAAFRFAARYVGHHASPTTAPGAWVAFRENRIVRAVNAMPAERRTLSTFTGDYNFLMERVPGDKTRGLDVVNIGPDNQRYGAWARILPAGETMRLALDPDFAGSLDGGDVAIRIVCLDETGASLNVVAGNRVTHEKLTGTGQWKELIVPSNGVALAHGGSDEQIEITANGAAVHLHMVEIQRGGD